MCLSWPQPLRAPFQGAGHIHPLSSAPRLGGHQMTKMEPSGHWPQRPGPDPPPPGPPCLQTPSAKAQPAPAVKLDSLQPGQGQDVHCPAAAELGTGPSRQLSPGCCPPPLPTFSSSLTSARCRPRPLPPLATTGGWSVSKHFQAADGGWIRDSGEGDGRGRMTRGGGLRPGPKPHAHSGQPGPTLAFGGGAALDKRPQAELRDGFYHPTNRPELCPRATLMMTGPGPGMSQGAQDRPTLGQWWLGPPSRSCQPRNTTL